MQTPVIAEPILSSGYPSSLTNGVFSLGLMMPLFSFIFFLLLSFLCALSTSGETERGGP